MVGTSRRITLAARSLSQSTQPSQAATATGVARGYVRLSGVIRRTARSSRYSSEKTDVEFKPSNCITSCLSM